MIVLKTTNVFLFVMIAMINSFSCLSQEKLSVLSFNIWDPNDVSFWEKYQGYPVDRIIKYISEDNADILLLQEVSLENNIKEQSYYKIKEHLKKKGYLYSAFYVPNYSLGKGDIGYYKGMQNSGYPLAILSKYPILETFANQSNKKAIMNKGILGVKILFNNEPLFIFNTHFGIGQKTTDIEMEKVAIPFINKVAGNNSVIFGGDFNCPSAIDTPNKSQTIGKYHYSTTTDQFLLNDNFTDAYSNAIKERNIIRDATCPAQNNIIKRVDRIYSRNTKLVPTKAFVKSNPWEYVNLKDHRAVFIEFIKKNNE